MKVLSKQNNSKMCIVCGLENCASLKANFYNMEDGSLGSIFTFPAIHQSYPDRVHGGMISALLDELAGRVIWVKYPEILGVTANLNIKFRHPVPLNTKLFGRAFLISKTERFFKAKAQILDQNKKVLAEAEGSYVILPQEDILKSDKFKEDFNVFLEDKIAEIDF